MEDEILCPRIVDTKKFVKDRIDQIADLLAVVDNSVLKPGEVTNGPRTVFQRLPRHMRRRAMSHNVKRLPRSVRNFASKSSLALHRKKPLSRKWRRRPTRLLKKLQRLRRQNVWLETHIWHAKRFRMADLWGWKLPIQSFQRGFRPMFRNAFNSAVVFDLSYLCCLQVTTDLTSNGPQAIVNALLQMCANYVSPSFGFRAALDEGLEISTMLFTPGKYPLGFIGPARFSWSIDKENNKCRLQIWSHPSAHSEIVNTIVQLTNSKLVTNVNPKEGNQLKITNLNNKEISQQTISSTIYISSKFTVTDMRHDLVRIRLIGPKIFPLLAAALHLVDDEEFEHLGLPKSLRNSNKFWRDSICANNSTLLVGNLRSGTTISLLVEDPRLFRNQSFKHRASNTNFHVTDLNFPMPCLSTFWDNDYRKKQLSMRLTNAQLEKKRSTHLLSGFKSSKFKIPILLIVQNVLSSDTVSASSAQNRIDLVAPGGTGLDFWLALQFASGRAAGLSDKISLDFESGVLSFPADCADSKAFFDYGKINASASRVKHLKRPQNRRLKYESRLCIKHPFTFSWSELIFDWRCFANKSLLLKKDKETSDLFVIRDRRVLLKLNAWFKNLGKCEKENQFPEKIFRAYENSLVAVKLTHILRGTSKRLALICLPTTEDLNVLKSDKISIIEEPKLEKPSILNTNNLNTNDTQKVEPNKIEEFMPFTEEEFEVEGKKIGNQLVCLNDLFPDEEAIKKKRKLLKKTKRKVVVKKKKKVAEVQENETITATNVNEAVVKEKPILAVYELENRLSNAGIVIDENMDDATKEIASVPKKSYRESCSRKIVGRVVRGDYSFVKGHSVAFGYCPLHSLPFIKNVSETVLLRNTSSKFYHPATININLMPFTEL